MLRCLIILLAFPFLAAAQSFSSHRVFLTPSARPKVSFDPEDHKKKLYSRYPLDFTGQSRSAEFVDMCISSKEWVMKSNFVYTNWPEANEYLRGLLAKIAPVADGEMEIWLVRDAEVNAFMMEDGTMCIYAGLLAAADNEAELLAILGHEIGHYVFQHAYKRFLAIDRAKNPSPLYC